MKYIKKLYKVERIKTITNGETTRDIIVIEIIWSGGTIMVDTCDIPKLLEDINFAMTK